MTVKADAPTDEGQPDATRPMAISEAVGLDFWEMGIAAKGARWNS